MLEMEVMYQLMNVEKNYVKCDLEFMLVFVQERDYK